MKNKGIVEIKMDLHSKLKIKDLGRLLYFLGMELLRSDEGILQCQKTWIFQMKLIWKKLSLQKLLDTSFKLEPNGKPVQDPTIYKRWVPCKHGQSAHTRAKNATLEYFNQNFAVLEKISFQRNARSSMIK